MRIGIEFRRIDVIPVLEVFDMDASEKAPMIIFMHGINNHKELHVKEAYKLAQHGFFVTLFDAHRHGEIQDEAFKKLHLYEKMAQSEGVLTETMKYIDMIIDDDYRTGIADPNRVGLTGISMGGVIIYKYIATRKRPNIKAAVPMIGSPLVGESMREFAKIEPEAAKYLHEEAIENLKKFDSQYYSQLLRLKDFPLLIQNSDDDPIFPITLQRKFYNELRSNYTDQEKIVMIEYQGLGHEKNDEMIEKTAQWFKKYL